MVRFLQERRPAQGIMYLISEDKKQNKIYVSAKPEKVVYSISYWLDSPNAYHIVSSRDEWLHHMADFGDDRVLQSTLKVKSGLAADMQGEEIRNAVEIVAEKEDNGTVVEIDTNIPNSLTNSKTGGKSYDPEELADDIYEWVKNNPEKVTLGYGPDHPLEDIEPVAVETDYRPDATDDITETFDAWLKEIAKRTYTNGNEYAFYVDENYNSIGVIEGGRSSVMYPSSRPDETILSAHSHPHLKSVAWPSETDLKTNVFRCNMRSVEMIVLGNYSVFFGERDWERDISIPEAAKTAYPFTELPVALVKRDPAMEDSIIERHHEDQFDKFDRMLEQQIQHKYNTIADIEDEVSPQTFAKIENEVQKCENNYEILIEENEAVEMLNEIGKDNNIKWTIQQEILPL